MDRKGSIGMIALIVIVIIFAACAYLFFITAPKNSSPDAERLANLSEVQKDLQLYWNKNGLYPDDFTWATMSQDLVNGGIGIDAVPNDPNSNATYYYEVDGNGVSYVIGAKLDDPHNPAFANYVIPSGVLPLGLTCAPADQEYCLAP